MTQVWSHECAYSLASPHVQGASNSFRPVGNINPQHTETHLGHSTPVMQDKFDRSRAMHQKVQSRQPSNKSQQDKLQRPDLAVTIEHKSRSQALGSVPFRDQNWGAKILNHEPRNASFDAIWDLSQKPVARNFWATGQDADKGHSASTSGVGSNMFAFYDFSASPHLHTDQAGFPPRTQPPIVNSINHRLHRPDARPFKLMERVKKYLGQNRVSDARRTLELGSIKFPEDSRITRLLRTISPGRVRLVDFQVASNREREFAWIEKNGRKYSKQWVAVEGNCLVAHAGTLKELLAKMDLSARRDGRPLIQKLYFE